MNKAKLDDATINALSLFELPDREMLNTFITVTFNGPVDIDIRLLISLLGYDHHNHTINVLSGNEVEISVENNLSDEDVRVVCDRVFATIGAQCVRGQHTG